MIHLVNIRQTSNRWGYPGKIYAGGLIFHYILLNTNGILRSCKKVRLSLGTMAIVCVCNICLNFFLVFATPVGYIGIAIATASSSLVGCLLNLRHVYSFVPLSAMAFAAKRVREIFGIGWPFALSQALWQLQSMALFLILSSLPRKSVEILAAFSSGLRIESAAFLPAIAFHMASAVITGNLSEKGDVPMLSGGCRDCSDGVSIVIVIALSLCLPHPGWRRTVG